MAAGVAKIHFLDLYVQVRNIGTRYGRGGVSVIYQQTVVARISKVLDGARFLKGRKIGLSHTDCKRASSPPKHGTQPSLLFATLPVLDHIYGDNDDDAEKASKEKTMSNDHTDQQLQQHLDNEDEVVFPMDISNHNDHRSRMELDDNDDDDFDDGSDIYSYRSENDDDDASTDYYSTLLDDYGDWSDVPYELQCNFDCAKVALHQGYISHLSVVPLEMQQNKEFRRACIIRGFQLRQRYPQTNSFCDWDWNELTDEWKDDFDVIVAALFNERVTLQDLPAKYRNDDYFLRRLCLAEPELFFDMPLHIRQDKAYWTSDHVQWNTAMVPWLIRQFPELEQNDSFWIRAMSVKDDRRFSSCLLYLEYSLPPTVLRDREIMFQICTKHKTIFQCLDGPLLIDREFIESICESLDPWDLRWIPTKIIQLFPQIIIQVVIPRVTIFDEVADKFSHSVSKKFWKNIDFVKVWIQNCGILPHRALLSIARHLGVQDCRLDSVENLLGDKTFMMKAIDFEPSLFRYCRIEHCDDLELRMLVIANVSDYEELDYCKMDLDDYDETVSRATEMNNVYQRFVTYLCCISYASLDVPISLLNQGEYTTQAHNRLVAEFLGLSMGTTLQIAQKCLHNYYSLYDEDDDSEEEEEEDDDGEKEKEDDDE